MKFDEQLDLIRGSKLAPANWYTRTYPDVAAIGMDPAEHYLRYGAALGRRPGPAFEPSFYRSIYPDAAASDLDPLVHHLLSGAKKERWTNAADLNQARRAVRRVLDPIQRKLLGLGFVARACVDLEAVVQSGATPLLRAHAARELAAWTLRAGTQEAARHCLALLRPAADCWEAPAYFAGLATLELLCLHHLDAPEVDGDAVVAHAEAAGRPLEDVYLARGNLTREPAARLVWINRALARSGVAPVALGVANADARLSYDRLTCPAPGPAITDGPLVSVLVAAFDSARTLPTALACLQAQRWRNLEILVIDDCSRDDTAAVAERFAAADPRIRIIRMARNGGAYVARNEGLAAAQGRFVTLHDADDWSHPDKISTQAAFLLDHPEAVGCTSEQARVTNELAFTRLTRTFKLVNMNTSSFMFRRAYVRATFGCWDSARFGADTELIARVTSADGRAAVRKLRTGPLSFQRTSHTSIVSDDFFGFSIMNHGARLLYADLYARSHRAGWVRASPDPTVRAFPAPRVMHARQPTRPRSYDVVLACDLSPEAVGLGAFEEMVTIAMRLGLTVGLVPMFDYARPPGNALLAAPVSYLLHAGTADVLAYGETADCRLAVLRDLACFQDERVHLPVVVSQAAVFVLAASELGPEPSAGRAALCRGAAFATRTFGSTPTWSPIDSAARATLAALQGRFAGAISSVDWSAANTLNALAIEL